MLFRSIPKAIWLDENTQNQTIIQGMSISIVSSTFLEPFKDKQIIFGEKAYNDHPSIVVDAITSNNAPEGDNVIRINFKYSDGEAWYTTQSEVTIHVKYWYEKFWNRVGLFIIGSLLLVLLHSIGDALYNYVSNKFEQNHNSTINKVLCPYCGRKEYLSKNKWRSEEHTSELQSH